MNSHFNGLTLGIHVLAEMCQARGYETVVYNADHSGEEYGDWKTIFDSYLTYKKSLSSENPLWHEIAKEIEKLKPDLIAMTVHGGVTVIAKRLAEALREVMPAPEIAVGGARVTVAPQDFMGGLFDKICVGEGEEVIFDLIEGASGVYRAPRLVPSLDVDPIVTNDVLYRKLGAGDFNAIETSRGCHGRCIFCSSRRLYEGKIRFKTPLRVADEVAYRHQWVGVKSLYVVDECFTAHRHRVTQLSRVFGAYGMTWTCEVRADHANRDMFQAMKDGGCTSAKIGLEVGTDRMLKFVKKGITRDQFMRCAELLHEVDLPFTIYLMIGFPGMSAEEHLETLEFGKSLGAKHYTPSITAPYPGTDLYDMTRGDLESAGIDVESASLTHLSDEMREFWGVPREVVQAYLDLSAAPKEEAEFEQGRYMRKAGDGLYD